MDLDHDGGVASREGASGERRERLVGALREDCVGGLASELPRDADRQRAVERRCVERRDRGAPLQGERAVSPGGAARRRSEDAQLAAVTEELQAATLLPSMPLDRLSGDETDG